MDEDFRLRPPKIKLREKDVVRACLDYLQYKHFYPVRLNSGLFPASFNDLCAECRARARRIRVGEVGLPDYVIPRFFMEVKRPGGRPSQEQRDKISELSRFWDVPTALVDSVEALIEWLKQTKY